MALSDIFSFIFSFTLLIIAMSVHEFAHAFVAYKLGDQTARFMGRLTLNPLKHIDPFWTLLLPFVLFISTQGRFVFGAAKPVPVNYWALKNPRKDMLLIGASGPLANLLFAAALSLIIRSGLLPQALAVLLLRLLLINVVLAIFNLIPIPPLDGSRILMGLLPEHLTMRFERIEPFTFIIIAALIFMGALDVILWPLVGLTLRLLGLNY